MSSSPTSRDDRIVGEALRLPFPSIDTTRVSVRAYFHCENGTGVRHDPFSNWLKAEQEERTMALDTAFKKYRDVDLRYARQVEEETGAERSLQVDHLADLVNSGHADVAAPQLEALLHEFKLDEDSLAYSRIAHQAGAAYRATRGGARVDALNRATRLFEKAYSSKSRKRHVRAWGETALDLAFCYREMSRLIAVEPQRSILLSKAELCIQEAADSFERLDVPGAFARASALQSLGNIAVERGDIRKSQRLYRKAATLIEERVQVYGWDDHACADPQRLYAQVLGNSIVHTLREGDEIHLQAALDELDVARSKVDQYWLHFLIAAVRSKLGRPDQQNLDMVASMEAISALPERDFDQVGVLLAGGRLTTRVGAFFYDAIEHFLGVRGAHSSSHELDHTAIRIRELARHWAALAVADQQHTLAFCVLERVSGLRMQAAARRHEWRPVDAKQDLLYFDYTAKAGISATFSGWADMISRMRPEIVGNKFFDILDKQLSTDDDLDQGDDAPSDEKNVRADLLMRGSWTRLNRALPSVEALRLVAAELREESIALRRQLELDGTFAKTGGALKPVDEAEIRRILEAIPDAALMRIEHVAGHMLVLYIDLVDGEIRSNGHFVDLDESFLKDSWLAALWKDAEISADDMAGLAKINIAQGIPANPRPRAILLPSAGLNLLPLLAMGPSGATLLDRFDSVSFAWSLAQLRVRLYDDPRRSRSVYLYPGRDRPFSDDESTVFHFIASSVPTDESSLVLGPTASRDEIVAAWRDARTVSFYGHGAHIQMGFRRGRVGPRLLLGRSETLGMDSLQEVTVGLDRAELWACESGIDFPWDPMFPKVADGFGLDYELSRCGVLGVVATQWEVSELATSFIVLKYRLLLSTGRDASQALCGAQRWWRDHAVPAIALADKWIEAVLELWATLVDKETFRDDFYTVQRFLESQRSEVLAAIRASVIHPLSHAAYRFSGLWFRMPECVAPEPSSDAEVCGNQDDRPGYASPAEDELVRISLAELHRLRGYVKPMIPPYRELFAYHHRRGGLLGVVTEDQEDQEFGFVVLPDLAPDSEFLANGFGLNSVDEAEAELVAEMRKRLVSA